MNITQLDQQLRSNTLAPVYVLLGAEAYLRQSAAERIGSAFAKDTAGGIRPTRIDADRTDPAAVVESAQSLGLFSTKQWLVVGDIGKWAADRAEALLTYIDRPNPDTMLIVWAEKLDQRTKFARQLLEKTTVVECKALYATQVPEWVRIECQRRGREISREAARLLAEAVGSDLHAVHQAIEKVMLYTEGKRLIGIEDVEAVVLETSQRTIFELLNAVGQKDRLQALRFLEHLLGGGEPPVRICTMLAWHWRILLRAREWQDNEARSTQHEARPALAAALKVSPFFAKDYAAQAKGFTDTQLRNGFRVLESTDRMLKRSRVRGKTILTRTIMQLTSALPA